MVVFLGRSMVSPSSARVFRRRRYERLSGDRQLTPTISDIRNAVLGQKQDVAALFDALRAGSRLAMA